MWNSALAKMISGFGLQKRLPSLGVGGQPDRVIDHPRSGDSVLACDLVHAMQRSRADRKS
jgi:hypothetical protein